MTPFEALEAALAKAKSQTALADICGVSQPAVWKWLKSSKRLPAEHVLAVEKATGVSRHHLRPDIYPPTDPEKPTRRRRASDEQLGPWDTGDYGNQADILDYTQGAWL